MDSFELIASDNADLLNIAAIYANIKALRMSLKEHIKLRDVYKNRADVAQRNEDTENYSTFFQSYLDEDNNCRLILKQLHQFGINDKECEGLYKATKR